MPLFRQLPQSHQPSLSSWVCAAAKISSSKASLSSKSSSISRELAMCDVLSSMCWGFTTSHWPKMLSISLEFLGISSVLLLVSLSLSSPSLLYSAGQISPFWCSLVCAFLLVAWRQTATPGNWTSGSELSCSHQTVQLESFLRCQSIDFFSRCTLFSWLDVGGSEDWSLISLNRMGRQMGEWCHLHWGHY